MADAILRRCPKCAQHKPAESFRSHYCAPCRKEYSRQYYLANRDKCIERNREWAEKNREHKNAIDREYRQKNKERVYAKSRAWVERNREKVLEYARKSRALNIDSYRAREAAYREKNRQACNERIKQWKAKNPDANVFYFHKRRAAQLQALPMWADLDAISSVYKKAQEMGAGYHVDHIVPLISKFVCGLHCEANLQVITAEENIRKNNRWWPDMWEGA
jgi:hypothetical protein